MIGGNSPETLEPWVHRLDEHVDRLRGSAETLGLADFLDSTALQEAVMATLERSRLTRARIRLTITAGDLNLLTRAAAQAALGESEKAKGPGHDPTVMIVCQAATTYPVPMFDRGVRATVGETRANPFDPFQGHKTLNYWWRLRELQIAASKGGAEAILLSITNHLASGCVSNVMIAKDGELLTPIARGEEGRTSNTPDSEHARAGSGDKGVPTTPASAEPGAKTVDPRYLPSPVLPGITRQWAIDTAELKGIRVRREMLSVGELLAADEVLLTNSSWGVLPVIGVEKATIGSGMPGPIAQLLRKQWLEETAG